MARAVTALLAPVSVARARIRRRPWRGLLAALGIAVATGMLGATIVGARVSSELSVQRALAHVPVEQRVTRVMWSGPPNGGYGAVDGPATRALGGLAPGPAVRTVLYRETRFDRGRIALLAGLGDAGRWLRLTSGRLPDACTPSRCEVVQIAGAPLPEASSGSLRLVRVGTGHLASALPFGSLTDLGASAGHASPPATLIAGDVAGVSDLPQLRSIYRTYAWSRPIDPTREHSWDIGSLLGRQARALTSLSAGFSEWSISAPDQAVIDAAARSDTAGSRLTLVGGEVAALLLAFVVLAATGLREDAAAERARLERRGARRGQVWAFALAEAGWIAAGGVTAGLAAAVAAGVLICRAAALPAGAVLDHSLLTTRGALLIAAALCVALAVMVAVFLAPRRGRGGWYAADAAAAAALAALALAAGRGATTAGGRPDPLLPLLPLLMALVAGVMVARLLGPLMRAAERRLRTRSLALRIAIISVAREPLQAAIGAAFMAVALGLAFFAVAYRDTLSAGQVDQAAFAVPADVTLREGAALVRPLEAAPIGRYRSLAGGTTALPVLRLSANAASTGTRLADVTALGLPAGGLTAIRWRGDTAAVSQAQLAHLLAPSAAPAALRGPALPPAGSTLRLQVRAAGAGVVVSLVAALPDGSFATLPMGTARPAATTLRRRLPGRFAGGRLVAVEIDRTAADSKIAIHQQGEGGAASGIQGTLRLGPLRAGGAAVTGWNGWIGRGGVTAAAGRPGRLRFAITGAQRSLLRPVQATDGRPLPVMASADIARAAAGGLIRLTFAGVALPARVVAVGSRFPTVSGSFAVADEARLATALNADDPGAAVPDELWLRARDPAHVRALDAAVRRTPFDVLARSSHAQLLASLRSDPLAQGVRLVLEAAALVAVALALAGLVLAVTSAARDDRVALFDLEAQGVPPDVLRRQLRLRAGLMTAVGLAAALAIGAALSLATVGLVRVTATATAPVPPLERHLAWAPVAAGLVLFLGAAALLVGLATRAAFSAALPARAAGDAP